MQLDVVDKIQKLLALSKSSNQHEAELALTRAKELAFKHELDLAQIQSEKQVEKPTIVKSEQLPVTERKLAQDYISAILQSHFRVRVIYTYHNCTRGLTLVGKKTDLEIATYVNEFLIRETKSLFEQFLTSKGVRVSYGNYYAPSWFYGCWEGLDHKLTLAERDLLKSESVERQSNFAVMIRNDKALVADRVKEYFPKLTNAKNSSGKIDNYNAISAGRKAGSSIDLNKALSNGNNNKQIN